MQRSRLALLLLATLPLCFACTVVPTITARTITPAPALCKSIVVLSPPAFYVAADPKRPASGLDLEMLAQGLLTQVSKMLNEAGNDTSTTLLSRPGSSLSQEVKLRHSTGVSHALVISAKRAVFASSLPREVDIDATLLDASTLQPIWEFTYQDTQASGHAVPKATQALLKSLRDSGFVK